MRINSKKVLRRAFKIIHILNLGIFVLSSAYIFIYALHKAGKSWLFIASLSGSSTVVIIFLVSFYLFAVYRGFSSSQNARNEHPLTASMPYVLFYNISSFYGIFIVWFISLKHYETADYFLRMSVGIITSTFFMWIIIDPIVGLFEMLLPSSRVQRRARIILAQENRKKEYNNRQNVLAEISRAGSYDRLKWQQMLESEANELACLISESRSDDKNVETKVIEIGVKAFRIGGVDCMRHLYFMTKQICERKMQLVPNLDYISIWWDGIGNWRCKWLEIESPQ
ncbi:MAG: hypothetical protein A2Y12_16155 [Planctomycetes bacterium GWF2_42_9]|nr:MAG: hypothetical protein A2Y12_16155 [Planctomycetes bacterium GWF2_42_9]